MNALILSLPTENATARQRIWRSLKASGAAVLRDGVYLMPAREDCRTTLDTLASDIREAGGMAHVLRVEEPAEANFQALFDRSAEFGALLEEITNSRQELTQSTAPDLQKQIRRLRKTFAALAAIDFYAGESQRQTGLALTELELHCARLLSPDEPQPANLPIARLNRADFQGQAWATRQRPWVDRLASAWLIHRYIDPQARFVWLASPAECPADAIGFDFDGARFSHVGSRVTFEVLAASFGLDHPAIERIGLLVHFLDVGGIQPPEATGIESVLAGLRHSIADDDALLAAATAIFDGLFTSFSQGMQSS